MKVYAALIIAIFLYLLFPVRSAIADWNGSAVDLPSFWAAGVQVYRNGESPYDPETLQEVMHHRVHVHPYLYPPPSLLIFFPLSQLDYSTAQHAVLIGNLVIILLLMITIPLFVLPRSSKNRSLAFFIVTAVCICGFHPTGLTLAHGQVNLLLIALLLAYWILSERKHRLLASLFLAAAVLLKSYPVIILPVLLITGRKRELFFTVFFLAIATLSAYLVLPSAVWSDWFYNILPTGGYMGTPQGLFAPGAIWNQSLNGFFARLMISPRTAKILACTSSAAVLFLSYYAIFRARRAGTATAKLEMIVILPAMYLIAPFSWIHHLVYLYPCILILLSAGTNPGRPLSTLCYLAVVLISATIASDGFIQFKGAAVLLLWILCLLTASGKVAEKPLSFRL